MQIALGFTLLAAGALLYCFAFGAFRRPNPARWTQLTGVGATICILSIFLVPSGLGFVIQGLIHPLADLALLPIWAYFATPVLAVVTFLAVPHLLAPAYAAAQAPAAHNLNTAPSIPASIAA